MIYYSIIIIAFSFVILFKTIVDTFPNLKFFKFRIIRFQISALLIMIARAASWISAWGALFSFYALAELSAALIGFIKREELAAIILNDNKGFEYTKMYGFIYIFLIEMFVIIMLVSPTIKNCSYIGLVSGDLSNVTFLQFILVTITSCCCGGFLGGLFGCFQAREEK